MTLQEELVRVWSTSKITVLFVTHSMEEAIFLGDRVAVLTPGPGRLRQIVDVEIPREHRKWSVMSADRTFNHLKEQVMQLVRRDG